MKTLYLFLVSVVILSISAMQHEEFFIAPTLENDKLSLFQEVCGRNDKDFLCNLHDEIEQLTPEIRQKIDEEINRLEFQVAGLSDNKPALLTVNSKLMFFERKRLNISIAAIYAQNVLELYKQFPLCESSDNNASLIQSSLKNARLIMLQNKSLLRFY